ncbi:MBOAT family O-acyltransferase [Ekhidna lutea]|uniref:MBOAT family O-acyltransferase n=1 Tax=Ekhidna lutea TaxID=447679 RepID=UPI0034DB35F2
MISSVSDYILGLRIFTSVSKAKKKYYFILSLLINLGILGFFKYYNFFIQSFSELLEVVGLNPNIHTLSIILPVGISFYTFQTLSYSIDIYRGRMKPTKDFLSFLAFVSFFPQLVAGPIERASNLLPQFHKIRKFSYEYGRVGMKLILWGFFKKVCIADNLSGQVDIIFQSYESLGALDLMIGALFFAFQIYCDFSGYSDMAIGLGKLFGFDLMTNFKYPYFSENIGEFWRRWHISLSSWFRDYVFIPLGGSIGTKLFRIRNLIIVFTVSGLWHGANWTFIFWGFLNSIYYLPSLFIRFQSESKIRRYVSICATFFFTCLAWIFFRSPTISDAFQYIVHVFENQLILTGSYQFEFTLLLPFILFEWLGKKQIVPIMNLKLPFIWRYSTYLLLIFIIIFFGAFNEQSFIYFQF